MAKRSWQAVLLIASMISIGAIYGWSATVAVFEKAGGVAPINTVPLFGAIALGIGAGVAVAGIASPMFGHAKTLAAGLFLWGSALIIFSAVGWSNASWVESVLWALVAGAGVGIAYLAIVLSFRALFANPGVLSGSIGPLGFGLGAAVFSTIQCVTPSLARLRFVYGTFGVCAVLLGLFVWLFRDKRLDSFASAKEGYLGKKSSGDGDDRLAYLCLLLGLNVAPGMALLSLAVPWLCRAQSWSTAGGGLAFCASLAFLPLGQLVWGVTALRFGERTVFVAMFLLRAAAFLAVFFSPQTLLNWLLLALCLMCHGGGFGLLPRLVARNRPGGYSPSLGLVLSSWGLGGALGIAAVLPVMNPIPNYRGFVLLAVTMVAGLLPSLKLHPR